MGQTCSKCKDNCSSGRDCADCPKFSCNCQCCRKTGAYIAAGVLFAIFALIFFSSFYYGFPAIPYKKISDVFRSSMRDTYSGLS
ncbi:hypothetical protein BBBOND_0300590 [Babesia bigemina]|uniref:Uncharacterized protein n=1 Tax=Babesia bigemina TaxID=5866 RepID=A0A061DB64_BABBI|nr:hypothetical protein BBBOND_0300590 [Babesia bigemina]CDR96154.1 hypothetical protein BBBOND_0300590 [Babesia bigemina]|eukprot:XP_012768340.1 hypothetical protein BBBOND_0300590 [Babesia bigemina]